jgi:hypothetical protein
MDKIVLPYFIRYYSLAKVRQPLLFPHSLSSKAAANQKSDVATEVTSLYMPYNGICLIKIHSTLNKGNNYPLKI